MTNNYDTLNKLQASGELKCLIQAGLVPVKIGTYLDIYRFVDARVKTGSKKTEAVNEASVKLKVCRATVFQVLRVLTK